MFSTLVLCSIIALAFCCISLLYFYYSKLKHISYLETQLMSLKIMFAEYQQKVENHLQSLNPQTLNNAIEKNIENPNSNVMSVLESISSETKNSMTENNLKDISNIIELSPENIMQQIPFFKIVNLSSNPAFTKNNTELNGTITEINSEEHQFDNDNDNDNNEVENNNLEGLEELEGLDCLEELDKNNLEEKNENIEELENIDLEELENCDNIVVNTKIISLDNKKNSNTNTNLSSNSNLSRFLEDENTEFKKINIISNSEINSLNSLESLKNNNLDFETENSLESMMNKLEELSDIASITDDIRTVNIKNITQEDLNDFSLKELKELCNKYNIKNKSGSKTELIKRISNANNSMRT